MAGTTIWKGSIHFGETEVPVKLHSAVKEERIQFHLLHRPDQARLHQQMICWYEKIAVPAEAQVKGFEVEEGRISNYVDGAGYREARPYVDEPLSRSSTIARPTIAAVPPYTEDLRRMRQIRASDEYDGRYGN